MSDTRRVRSDSDERSKYITQAQRKAELESIYCAHNDCTNLQSGLVRFCSLHRSRRRRTGAADKSDVLPLGYLKIAKDALSPVVAQALAGYDAQAFTSVLNGHGDFPELTRREFSSASRRFNRATNAAYLRLDLLKRGFLSPIDYASTVLAAKGAYAILREQGRLGWQTNGWTSSDHENAWRVVSGRQILRRQKLLDREIPTGVIKQVSLDLEERFPLLTWSDDELVEIIGR